MSTQPGDGSAPMPTMASATPTGAQFVPPGAAAHGGAAALSMPPPSGHLRGLIMQKEKELHDINEYRIHTLESLVSDKEKDITEHKQRLQKMKDDFCFNLKLLEERETGAENGAARPAEERKANPSAVLRKMKTTSGGALSMLGKALSSSGKSERGSGA